MTPSPKDNIKRLRPITITQRRPFNRFRRPYTPIDSFHRHLFRGRRPLLHAKDWLFVATGFLYVGWRGGFFIVIICTSHLAFFVHRVLFVHNIFFSWWTKSLSLVSFPLWCNGYPFSLNSSTPLHLFLPILHLLLLFLLPFHFLTS